MFGVAPIDFDINESEYTNCGWYLFCFYNYSNPQLYSGPPHNFKGKATNLNPIKDVVIIIMDMDIRSLKFIIDNEDKGESYTNIPIDKPLVPSVHLYNIDDSVEIIKC